MKCPKYKCKIGNPDDSKFCRKCATPLTKIPATLTSLPPEKEEKPEKSALDFAPAQYFSKRYHIVEEIGQGGMGRVYKCKDTRIKRSVVVKFLPPELNQNEKARERFVFEAQAGDLGVASVCYGAMP